MRCSSWESARRERSPSSSSLTAGAGSWSRSVTPAAAARSWPRSSPRLLLLPSTILMGGTLPAMTRHALREGWADPRPARPALRGQHAGGIAWAPRSPALSSSKRSASPAAAGSPARLAVAVGAAAWGIDARQAPLPAAIEPAERSSSEARRSLRRTHPDVRLWPSRRCPGPWRSGTKSCGRASSCFRCARTPTRSA